MLEDHVEQADHGDDLPDDLDEGGEALPDHAHVVDHPGHERAHLRLFVKVQGQVDDFVKKLLPQLFDDAQGAEMHTPVLYVAAHALQRRQSDEGQGHVDEGLRVLPDEDVVERGLDEPCRARCGGRNHARRDQCHQHGPLVGQEVAEDPQGQPDFLVTAFGSGEGGVFLCAHAHNP